MCGSAAGTELCSSPPGKRELEEGPGQTPLIAISIFFQPGLPLAGRGTPSSRREGERCAYFFARRSLQAPRAALPGLLQYRGEAGKKCRSLPRVSQRSCARCPPAAAVPLPAGRRGAEPRTPGIVAAPRTKPGGGRRWSAFPYPPSQLPPGKGSACLGCEWRGRGGWVGGGWGTRFPCSKHCSETVAEKIKVSSLFLSSSVPFLPHTQSFVSIQEKIGESPN